MLSVIITLLADGFNVVPTRLPGSPDHELKPPRQDCQGTLCAYIPLDVRGGPGMQRQTVTAESPLHVFGAMLRHYRPAAGMTPE